MSSIMIRVTPEDHDRWFKAHSACEEARREYGMSDGPLYRDAVDPTEFLEVRTHSTERLNKGLPIRL